MFSSGRELFHAYTKNKIGFNFSQLSSGISASELYLPETYVDIWNHYPIVTLVGIATGVLPVSERENL